MEVGSVDVHEFGGCVDGVGGVVGDLREVWWLAEFFEDGLCGVVLLDGVGCFAESFGEVFPLVGVFGCWV